MTLTNVSDPATPADQFNIPDPGNKLVGVYLTIKDVGASGVSDNANLDVGVVGTDGQDYSADFNSIMGCTNFNNGDYVLSPGEAQRGCVTFQLPRSVKVARVQFTTMNNLNVSSAEWSLRPPR